MSPMLVTLGVNVAIYLAYLTIVRFTRSKSMSRESSPQSDLYERKADLSNLDLED